MTLLRLLFTSTCLMSFIFASAQNNDAGKTTSDYSNPFGNGKNSFSFRQNGFFGTYKTFVNDVEVNKSNALSVDLNWTRWFKGGFGAGLRLSGDWDGEHPGDVDDLHRKWTVSPSLSYGRELSSNKLYGYVRIGGTFGAEKEIYKTPSNTTENEADLVGLKGTVGLPLRVLDNTFLTTRIDYESFTSNFDDGKEKDNGFGIRIGLEDYLHCNEFACDCKNKYTISRGAYDQGSSFIDYTSNFSASFGKTKLTYDVVPGTYENNYNNIRFNAGYTFYFIDYVAIGAQFGIRNSVQKSDDNDLKYTWNSFNFGPEITANVPVDNKWRNVFLRGGVNFASDKYEVELGSNTNTDKYSHTGFYAGIGANHLIEKHTAFQTFVGYRSTKTEEKSTGDESTTRGLFVTGGLRFSF